MKHQKIDKQEWKRNCAFSRRCRMCDRALKQMSRSFNFLAFALESAKLSGYYPEKKRWQ